MPILSIVTGDSKRRSGVLDAETTISSKTEPSLRVKLTLPVPEKSAVEVSKPTLLACNLKGGVASV